MKQLLTKKRNKKGFTLVELIIVIVIIAVLAAIAIPSMIGYIKRADEATATANCRAVLSAAQAASASVTANSDLDFDDEVASLLGTKGTGTGGEAAGSFGKGTYTVDNPVTTVIWTGSKSTATWTSSTGAIKAK